jgi:hypothetical protein
MTALLDRVRREMWRRSEPRPEFLDFLRREELREVRSTLLATTRGDPLDTTLLARMERRARVRRRLGLRLRDPNDSSFKPDPWGERPCAHPTYHDCDCTLVALDTRRISTRKGLEHHTQLIHTRRYPPTKPEQPERRPLAKVFAFRRPEPPEEPLVRDDPLRLNPVCEPAPLDRALQARLESGPLETIEELSRRLGVPLYPQPPERSNR